jgi:hypothetical protein
MSADATQIVFAGVVGCLFAVGVYRLARSQKLSFRYTVGWLALCGMGIFAGLLVPVIDPISNALKLSPAALVAVGAILLLVLICIQLSISISGLQSQVRRLTEECADLRLRLESDRVDD